MITNLTVTRLNEPRSNGIVGFATATFDKTFTVNSISIRQNQMDGNLYVRMPQRRTQNGTYIDVCHPLSANTRNELNRLVLDCFNKNQKSYTNLEEQFSTNRQGVSVSAQNCVKYNTAETQSNVLGRMDLVVGDMVIHNAKLYANANGEPQLSLPSYKDSKGDYHGIVIPTDKAAFQELRNVAINEYNTEYKFLECSPEDIQALKENTNLRIKTKELSNGNIAIKFNAKDMKKINDVLQQANAVNNSITR